MLMAHPVVLKGLLAQYDALRGLVAQRGTPGAGKRFEDVAHALCVATDTRDVDAAAIAARYHLPGTDVRDDSLLAESPDAPAAQGV